MKKIVLLPLTLCLIFFAGCQTTPKQRVNYDNWQSRVVGTYKGIIFSSGIESPGVTKISKDADGNFKGDYNFTEKNTKITGILYGFQIISPLKLKCKWKDKYGIGDLSMSFNESVTGFSGSWNVEGKSEKFPWNGSK
jgi:hypothetical protein